ncbi:MAG: thioesterase family protein [Pseudomonadota bacterium]
MLSASSIAIGLTSPFLANMVSSSSFDNPPSSPDAEASDADLSWDYLNPFVIQATVGPADIDSYQHANNSVYVRWFDECARQHSLAVGIDTEEASELGYGMAVRESRITYHASAYLNDTILIANWIVKNDRKLRATRHFQIIRPSDGATLARADINYICINIASGKPSKMPPAFREKYGASIDTD